jgi:hypothetical protein
MAGLRTKMAHPAQGFAQVSDNGVSRVARQGRLPGHASNELLGSSYATRVGPQVLFDK